MRDYDPTTGRYLQADPLGLVDGASVDGYVRQNPLRFSDPRGVWVVGPQSGRSPDYNPYTNNLVRCDSDHCFDQWMKIKMHVKLSIVRVSRTTLRGVRITRPTNVDATRLRGSMEDR